MKISELLNRSLGLLSMYKGLLVGLLFIWLVALVLSITGALALSPIALVVGLLVTCGATWLGSWIAGWLFGVHSQADSSLITGLILTLIITPTMSVSSIAVMAFAGVVAGVSKYILTWRGRHIFNPAALAAVVVTVSGLGSASWWIATPALTPAVLLCTLIVLYQTKRFRMAGIFLAITVPVTLVQLLSFGSPLDQALWLLLSWPLLFIVGVMLVEPLTLPPKKWQVYTVTIIVALLVAVPFSLGPIHMTPALALLVGNLIAAVMARRSALQLTLKERIQLTPSSFELRFSPSRPVSYEAGQFIEISLPHAHADLRGERRSFSVTSAPGDEHLSLGIKFYEPSSSFKKALTALKETPIQVTQQAGDFVLPKDATKPLLYIAGGIGITPFISHIRTLIKQNQTRDIIMIYAISNAAEFAYADELSHDFIKGIVISPERPPTLPANWQHIEGRQLNLDAFLENIDSLASRRAYISGPTPFVQSAKHQLRHHGVRHIVTDYFVGY